MMLSVAANSYRNFQPLVTDHGELLCALHMDIGADDAALDAMLSETKKLRFSLVEE